MVAKGVFHVSGWLSRRRASPPPSCGWRVFFSPGHRLSPALAWRVISESRYRTCSAGDWWFAVNWISHSFCLRPRRLVLRGQRIVVATVVPWSGIVRRPANSRVCGGNRACPDGSRPRRVFTGCPPLWATGDCYSCNFSKNLIFLGTVALQHEVKTASFGRATLVRANPKVVVVYKTSEVGKKYCI